MLQVGQDKKFRKNDMLVWWVREVHFLYFSASISFKDLLLCFFFFSFYVRGVNCLRIFEYIS